MDDNTCDDCGYEKSNKWTQITKTYTLDTSKTYNAIIAAGNYVVNGISGTYLTVVNGLKVTNGVVETLPTNALIFTLAYNGSHWTFARQSDNKLLGVTNESNAKMSFGSGTTTWDIGFNSDDEFHIRSTISSTTDWCLRFNTSATPNRIGNYKHNQTAVELYVK